MSTPDTLRWWGDLIRKCTKEFYFSHVLVADLNYAADEIEKLQAENAKLREQAHLVAEYVSEDQCEGCVTKRACNAGELDMCWIRKAILEKLRELGVIE